MRVWFLKTTGNVNKLQRSLLRNDQRSSTLNTMMTACTGWFLLNNQCHRFFCSTMKTFVQEHTFARWLLSFYSIKISFMFLFQKKCLLSWLGCTKIFLFSPPRTLRLALSILKTGFILIQCCIQGIHVMPYSDIPYLKAWVSFYVFLLNVISLFRKTMCVSTQRQEKVFSIWYNNRAQ